MAASEIANDLGMICSFMPKPFANRPGNGMHIHMSLGDGKPTCCRQARQARAGPSKLAYQFLAGILAHAPALAAICAPTVNSSQASGGRPLPHRRHLGPAYISYGDNNRSSMVRIPTAGSSCACRTAPATPTSPPPR